RSVTRSAPEDFETWSSASRTAISGRSIFDGVKLAVERDLRRRLVEDDVEIVFEFGPVLPLPADQRRGADILDRVLGPAAFPGDRPDQRVVVGRGDRIADRGGVELLRPLQRIDREFETGMLEADRLGPLLAGGGGVGVAELLRRLAGEARFEGM